MVKRIGELPELATAEEVAEVLRCSPATVRARCADGQLRASYIAGRWLVDGPGAVRDFVKSCENTPPASTNRISQRRKTSADLQAAADDAAVRRVHRTLDELKGRLSKQRSAAS